MSSEGFGQVPVEDLDTETLAQLVNSGHATVNGTSANIGGETLYLGQLAKYQRSGIMIHCGGSNAPDPLADNQPLLRTFGCTRMHNADWKQLASWLELNEPANHVVYSIVGDPLTLPD